MAYPQAGIPIGKLHHPSIKGLFAKYTKVAGCIPTHSAAYRNVNRISEVHLASIRNKLQGKKVCLSVIGMEFTIFSFQVWVATDEWTSDLGYAIVNVIIGTGGKSFVTGTLQIECRGENMGVEHSAVAAGILDNLRMMNISLSDVMTFVSDSAAVLKKAFNDVLSRVCPDAIWTPCAGHILNNCAKVCSETFL